MVTERPRAGLYRHYKKGDLYRVLFLVQTPDVFEELNETLVVFVGPDGTIFIGKEAHIEQGQSFLFEVKNSSNVALVGLCVVYVSLSDGHGRLSVRDAEEFKEEVDAPSCADDARRVPRFERIGD